jgi:hypothetical protein
MTTQERQDLIDRYAAGFDVLVAAWHEIPPDARKWKPGADAWSAHEIIAHCADSETMAATRIRLLISEPNPIISGYDQEEWVDIFRYHDRDVDLCLNTIQAVRAYTVPVLRAMPDAAWSASGSHTQDGRYRAEDWLQIYGQHLHDHADQIRDNLRQYLLQA